MNILFLGEPNSPNTISWVDGLRSLGCVVTVASARSNGKDGAYSIGPQSLPARLRMMLGISDVKKLIRKFKPDIIIAYRVTSYGYVAARTGFHPFVLAAQNENIAYHPTNSIFRGKLLSYFARYAVKKADLIHSWSLNITKGLKKFGAEDSRILQLHRGINLSIFRPPETQEWDNKHIRIISTRSLYPIYRINDIIRAFSIFNSNYEDSSLVIVGEGPVKQDLIELTKKLDLIGKVTFTGKMNAEKTAAELRKADFYVSIIETEGLSSSLLEACACGVFPIVADIPASRTIIENAKNGTLLSNTIPTEIAKALMSAVENRNLMKDAAQINIKLVKDSFDRDNNLKQFLNKYLELIETCK